MQGGFDKLSAFLNNYQTKSRLSMLIIMVHCFVEVKPMLRILLQSQCSNQPSFLYSPIERTRGRINSIELLCLITIIILIWQYLSYQEQSSILLDLVNHFIIGISKVQSFNVFVGETICEIISEDKLDCVVPACCYKQSFCCFSSHKVSRC